MLFTIQSCSNNSDNKKILRNVILVDPIFDYGDVTISYPGIIEENASVSAAFMAEGKIGSISVKEGDRVHKGQLLASLDDSDYKIGVAQLEAQYNQLTKEKERMDAMFERHNIAPNDYEKFTTGYEQMKLQLDMAKRKLDYTRLYSPSSGYIATKYMNVGELVGAGTPVFNIIDDSNLIASVDLPVKVYLDKKNIVNVYGSIPGVGDNIPLTMISFTPVTDNNMLYRMKLTIPNKFSKELTAGMNITVLIETKEDETSASLIPSRAIFSGEGKSYVWIYNPQDSTIHKKQVEIEGAPVDKMQVVKGLSTGESIVETGVKQLYEGEKVNVLKRNEIGL